MRRAALMALRAILLSGAATVVGVASAQDTSSLVQQAFDCRNVFTGALYPCPNNNPNPSLLQQIGAALPPGPPGQTGPVGPVGPVGPAGHLASSLDAKSDLHIAMDGTTDDAAILNAATASLPSGAVVYLPPGQIRLGSTLLMRPTIAFVGAGSATVLNCATATSSGGVNTPGICVGAASGVSVNSARLSGVRIVPATPSDSADTVMAFPSIGYSNIGWVYPDGFTTGTILTTGGAVPSVVQDPHIGGNVVFNSFHDIYAYGCGLCVVVQGHIPSATSAPDQVNTQNTYENINLWSVLNIGIDIPNAADTNVFVGGLINLAGAGSTGVMQADDPRYSGGAIPFVDANKFFGLAFSHAASATSLTLFGSPHGTFKTEGYGIETDIDLSKPGYKAVDMQYATSYRLCGTGLTGSDGKLLGCLEKGISWKGTNIGSAATAGGTYTTPQNVGFNVISGSGSADGYKVLLPTTPPDGTVETYATTAQTITTVTWGSTDPNGGVGIYGAPSTISTAAPAAMKYIAGSNSWVHVSGGS